MIDKTSKENAKKSVEKKVKTKKTISKKKELSTTSTTVKKIDKAKVKTTAKTKAANTKTTSKITKKSPIEKRTATAYIPEFYELPGSYDSTVVKILAQTPNKLFVYWEISQKDRESFMTTYGNDFFTNSYPILLITNTTKNYKFEVAINDFANCWYLDINDANCKYVVELARKPIFNNNDIRDDFIYVTHSNHLDIPNNSVLFNVNLSAVEFKNIQTNSSMSYDFTHLTASICEESPLPFMSRSVENNVNNENSAGTNDFNNIRGFYKKLYYNNHSEFIYSNSNPSS